MKAHLSFGEHGLIAQLENKERIIAIDAEKMAGQLHLAGVTEENLSVANWKTDPDHSPMSGQIITIKTALRKFAESK